MSHKTHEYDVGLWFNALFKIYLENYFAPVIWRNSTIIICMNLPDCVWFVCAGEEEGRGVDHHITCIIIIIIINA